MLVWANIENKTVNPMSLYSYSEYGLVRHATEVYLFQARHVFRFIV